MGQLGENTPDWNAVGVDQSLASHLQTLGYQQPTALQQLLIPAIASESDVLIEAPAGTGRTVAVAVAVAELITDCDPGDAAIALIVSSSDQRCQVLAKAVRRCGQAIARSGEAGVRTAVVSELGPISSQSEIVKQPLDVIIGTPRRLDEMASSEQLDLDALEMVIIDDADALAVSDQADALANLIDSIDADRQRVAVAGALLPPLTDLIECRLDEPRLPRLPITEPARTSLPQRAFALANPTPENVGTLAALLGSPTTVLVPAGEIDDYTQYLSQSAADLAVAPISDPGPLAAESTVICTRLPSWTDQYVELVAAATEAGCAELVLLSAPAHRQLLRALGRAGGAHLNAAPFPTEHAVETRQIMKLEELVAEQLSKVSSQPTPRFLASVHRLSADFDVADIAAAAMELAHQAHQREIQPGEDIPVLLRQSSPSRPADRRQGIAPTPDSTTQRRKGGDRRGKEVEPGMTRLFVAAGYNYGVRPGDIVGAFAGESGLSGKEIGNIDIRESFTLVEVPEKSADDVIDAMVDGTIKGRQIEVRRERY